MGFPHTHVIYSNLVIGFGFFSFLFLLVVLLFANFVLWVLGLGVKLMQDYWCFFFVLS